MSSTPQGWFPDPAGRHQLRWWNGRAWAAAVADDGVQSFDPDGLSPGAPDQPRVDASDAEHAEVVRACHVGALPGDDALTAPVLSVWHRRSGLVDLHPTWSVHDGVGRWLGTFSLAVSGPTPDDRSFVLHRPDGTSLSVTPDRPRAVARLIDSDGTEVARVAPVGHSAQRVEVVVDGMVVTSTVYSVGEVTLADNSGATIARLVPPPLGVRRRIGRRVGWDPVLVSEQTSVADPVTGRGVNALALAWEHTVREWAG